LEEAAVVSVTVDWVAGADTAKDSLAFGNLAAA